MTEEEQDFNDFQTYMEGGPEESQAAARRMDERSVRSGQMSREEFHRTWREWPS